MQVHSADSGLTIEECEDVYWEASDDTVPYVGVKKANQCWCGSFVGGKTSRNPVDCDIPCARDGAATCGGRDGIDVFEPVSNNDLLPSVPVTATIKSPITYTTNAVGPSISVGHDTVNNERSNDKTSGVQKLGPAFFRLFLSLTLASQLII